MRKLVGRKHEIGELNDVLSSKRSEFLVVYGRRRIGKTFLIKEHFKNKPCTFFHVTGIKDGTLNEQLQVFTQTIADLFYDGADIATPNTWMKAFDSLNRIIQKQPSNKPIIIFMDEFPWMATKRSRLLQSLEYYWNRHWEDLPHLKLIVCGSSASWIVKKILYHKGGLHNRITRQMVLKPFSLQETKAFLEAQNIKIPHQQVIDIYLTLGGIPFYLEGLKSNTSVLNNINNLCFKETGLLFYEFDKLFQSLFDNHENYAFLVRLIGSHREGIPRAQIEKQGQARFLHGGRLTEHLKDLEIAGFIRPFRPLYSNRYSLYYRINDEFCYFYLKWVENEKATLLSLDTHHHYWNQKATTPGYAAWSGYAFEMLCYKHIAHIKRALNIPEDARIGSWRYCPRDKEKLGSQIDLIFEQHDAIIVCEIKHSNKPYTITKEYAQKLQHKVAVFQEKIKPKKPILIAMIASSGIKSNAYSKDLIHNTLDANKLFKGY